MISRHVRATEHLQRIATQLISARGTEVLYEQILDTALAILHADLGSIQKFCSDGSTQGGLRLEARGLGSISINVRITAVRDDHRSKKPPRKLSR